MTSLSADMQLFDHVTIKVPDLAVGRAFYEGVMAALGCTVVFEVAGDVVGFGHSARVMFEIADARGGMSSAAAHIAFLAQNKAAVCDFHAAALLLGGRDNGRPGLRPECEPGYFAAYVIDPNGHNLEAVFHVSAERSP